MNIKLKFPLPLCLALFPALITMAGASRPDGERTLAIPVRHPARLLDILCDGKPPQRELFERPSFPKMTASGATGANVLYESGQRDVWYIESQRSVVDRMEALVVNRLARGVDIGVMPDIELILKWAFDRQADDGGFPGTADPYHSGEIFINSVARGFLLIRQSGLPEYQFIVDKYLDKLRLAAGWFLDSKDAARGRERNKPFTHRRYILAEALGSVAALTGDKRLEAFALELAREGVSLLTPDGISPELGGFDTNYSNAGALQAMRYWFVCPDAGQREALLKMARTTLGLIGERVGGDGSVNVKGDSRIGANHVNRDGKPKEFNRAEGIYSFCLGYYLLGDESCLGVAEKIARGRRASERRPQP
ncbi:MAG: hypothetical protein LBM92_02410 [Opitutaceae bacterium]|nr:hypothetical protein [Opitutaceae bacterium]